MGPFVAGSVWSRRSLQTAESAVQPGRVSSGYWIWIQISKRESMDVTVWLTHLISRSWLARAPLPRENTRVWLHATIEPLKLKDGSNSHCLFLQKCKWRWWCNESVWICVNRRAASHWSGCILFTLQAPYPINTVARRLCIHLGQIAGTQARGANHF